MTAPSTDRAWTNAAATRLALGFTQGVCLWLLERATHDAWAVHGGGLWAALLLVAVFVPLIPMASVGRMRTRTLLVWTAIATLLLVALTFYDAWRAVPDGAGSAAAGPSAQLVFFGGGALYILHHLIEPADEARRWWPAYAAYVDGAWRHAFQLALSLAFTLMLWGVLNLGAGLFAAIGVASLASALRANAFVLPTLGLAFAYAVHRTDVSPQMIESVRNLGLTLLSWLLLVATALIGVFLFSLLFTGLEPLWNTRQSARLLLTAAATLVVLVNAAYQDGRHLATTAHVLRWAGRIAALLLPLLVALAAWSLALRVRQYGLTPERAGGFAVCVITAVYACGYAWAAVARGPWLQRLERVNVIAAVTGALLIAAVLSPLADPARISINDQLARLKSGAVSAAHFDFAALQFRTARFGRDALATLTRSSDPAIATRARAAQALGYYGESEENAVTGEPFSSARVRPATATLPGDFRAQQWPVDKLHWNAGRCLVSNEPCDLFVVDLDGDGSAEVVAMSEQGDASPVVFARGRDGVWRIAGSFVGRYSDSAALAAIVAGEIEPTAALLPDLKVGRLRLRFEADSAYQEKVDNDGVDKAARDAPAH